MDGLRRNKTLKMTSLIAWTTEEMKAIHKNRIGGSAGLGERHRLNFTLEML